MDYRDRIVRDTEVRFGRPVVKGTRIAVGDVLGFLAAGDEATEILNEFPQLAMEDILACLSYAADKERFTRTV
jgi:uncharacterized protein (DUF433 family)